VKWRGQGGDCLGILNRNGYAYAAIAVVVSKNYVTCLQNYLLCSYVYLRRMPKKLTIKGNGMRLKSLLLIWYFNTQITCLFEGRRNPR